NNQKERLQEIIHLEDKIKASSNKFSKSEHTREFRESFKLTPLLSLNIAKAYFLSGKYDMVEKYLPVAAQDKNLLNAIYELNMGLQRVSVKK
ncbi:MAG: hypothetical protein Q8942_20240, partial [Bacillota bacterium]|nr:hypothetical protein [Bacillota bacterium]